MNLKQIYIFRHGETDWNVEGRFQGHLDIPLNEEGKRQAEALGKRLKSIPLEAILSSDLSRSKETASIIASQLDITVAVDPRLREAHLGDAQGRTWEEIKSKFGPEIVTRWKSNRPTDADVAYPGGETGSAVLKRVMICLEEFCRVNAYDSLGVSSHGGVIRRLVHHIRQSQGASPLEAVSIPNTVLYLLCFDLRTGKWSYPSQPHNINVAQEGL